MGPLKQAALALVMTAASVSAGETTMELNPEWEYVADTVMGGVSSGELAEAQVAGRAATRLTGDVSLENNGGFIQMAADLAGGAVLDASQWAGIEIELRGIGAGYELRLRTDALSRPWQSYRVQIEPSGEWQIIRFDWGAFEAHRTDAPFDPARLRRIGVLAIGAEMRADIAVAAVRFFK